MTGSSDQTVKVWLYREGLPTHVGVGHAGTVTNVKMSPDGRLVVSTSVDGGIYLWRFPHDDDLAPDSRCSSGGGDSGSSGGKSSRSGDSKSSAGDRGSASSLREQQSNSSRRLSQKRTVSARPENIGSISKSQSVLSVTDAEPAAANGNATSDGSSCR